MTCRQTRSSSSSATNPRLIPCQVTGMADSQLCWPINAGDPRIFSGMSRHAKILYTYRTLWCPPNPIVNSPLGEYDFKRLIIREGERRSIEDKHSPLLVVGEYCIGLLGIMSPPLATVGIASLGEMGAGIAKLLSANNHPVLTNVSDRRQVPCHCAVQVLYPFDAANLRDSEHVQPPLSSSPRIKNSLSNRITSFLGFPPGMHILQPERLFHLPKDWRSPWKSCYTI